ESAPPKWLGNSLHGTSTTLRMNHSRFVAAIVCDIPMSLFVFSLCIENYTALDCSAFIEEFPKPVNCRLAVPDVSFGSKSRHMQRKKSCPLYPPKADINRCNWNVC